MCGIIGGITKENITPILMEGLKRLEYRGYDSAGMALINKKGELLRIRAVGKVIKLEQKIDLTSDVGNIGIAHTRWATHGEPSKNNAHPHLSGNIAIVHNGIIENHDEYISFLQNEGYKINSETDTEIMAHLIHYHQEKGLALIDAIREVAKKLKGAYAIAVIDQHDPTQLVAIRKGSPLVVGIAEGAYFIASDQLALREFADKVVFLEEDDRVLLNTQGVKIIDKDGEIVRRKGIHLEKHISNVVEKGRYKHYMLKEIYEQSNAIAETLEGRIGADSIPVEVFGPEAKEIFSQLQCVHIVACGTSYHAGMVAKYWIEELAQIPCIVDIASEYRYRNVPLKEKTTLFITISQSGETADTLAALRKAKTMPYFERISICNVAESSLARESDRTILTRAGVEIGVASTKAFTTQLVILLLLSLSLANARNLLNNKKKKRELMHEIKMVPDLVRKVLKTNHQIKKIAHEFFHKEHVLFLGRGLNYPIALEGALKLKEISYINAEGYPSGELKHGPLALVDENLPVIAIAPNDFLFEKIKSNLNEVLSRSGKLYVFSDNEMESFKNTKVIKMPTMSHIISPIIYTIPLQLLAYHVADLKGTDIDQPRNLAKSVTVE